MGAVPNRKYTEDEYLEMELNAPYKSEFYRGEIFPMAETDGNTPEAMSGALPPHNRISSNLIFEFESRLRKKNCRPFNGDQQIFIPENSLYTYPDISVFCGELQYKNAMCLTNPVLLVEILSKVTEGYNRGQKFALYRSIPTLVEYLMIDSQRVYVELWRKENNTWTLAAETENLNETMELKSINETFLLENFYFEAVDLIEKQQSLKP